jgi:hypothetical protein
MKNRILVSAFFLTILFAAPANAALKDRLVPITSGKVTVSVDTFIVGTHDRYIATIVRNLDEEAADEVGDTMRDMAALHGNKNLVLVEKLVLDKNAARLSMIERYMALASDLQVRLSSEPLFDSAMHEAAPGTLGGVLWNKIAGPDGLGRKILGEDPAPAALSETHKNPVDAKRYAVVSKNRIGGIFLDRDSIKKTDAGCSAVMIEAFDYDAELHFGGMAMQYTHQPYVDAHQAVSTYEYSFGKKAHRLLRFTKFSADGKVIYSIRNPNLEWITADTDPVLPALLVVRANLPENVATLLPDDIKSFDAYVRERIAKAAKAQEKSQDKGEAGKAEEKHRDSGKTNKK